MRYEDKGEIHRDFHLATNRTIDYVMIKHGEEFLKQLCRRTAQLVYRDIYNKLKEGDTAPLLEHLHYYIDREGGACEAVSDENGTRMIVEKCPMLSYISSRGHAPSQHMGLFLTHLYESWGEDTPFEISVELEDSAADYIILIRKKDASK